MQPCIKEWSPETPLKSSFIGDKKALLGSQSVFGQQMGLMVQWPIGDEPPSYKVRRNKETIAWKKIKVWAGYKHRTLGHEANTITTELIQFLGI